MKEQVEYLKCEQSRVNFPRKKKKKKKWSQRPSVKTLDLFCRPRKWLDDKNSYEHQKGKKLREEPLDIKLASSLLA